MPTYSRGISESLQPNAAWRFLFTLALYPHFLHQRIGKTALESFEKDPQVALVSEMGGQAATGGWVCLLPVPAPSFSPASPEAQPGRTPPIPCLLVTLLPPAFPTCKGRGSWPSSWVKKPPILLLFPQEEAGKQSPCPSTGTTPSPPRPNGGGGQATGAPSREAALGCPPPHSLLGQNSE